MSISTFYVSPNGTGSGTSENSPALYTSSNFWADIKNKLSNEAVKVFFLNGIYNSPLPLPDEIGNPIYQLILEARSSNGVVFWVPEDDPPQDYIPCTSDDRKKQVERILFNNCQNIILSQFLFTGSGSIGYVVRLVGTTKNITIENCTFEDMPRVIYGVTGVHGGHRNDVHHITYRECHFKAAGCDGHAHMMYHAYVAHHIQVLNCTFEDCAGDYVRFRDKVDYCVVSNCSFISSGLYPKDAPASPPFVAMPLFNDCKPGTTTGDPKCPDPLEDLQYEYFGTNYVITTNKFLYNNHPPEGNPYAIGFYHFGFDPPGRNHLMTAVEGWILEHGTADERKALLKENCGIDCDKVKVYGNQYSGAEKKVAFGSNTDYGAISKGWEGYVDIEDLVNEDKIVSPPRWIEAFIALKI
jgi:hypothetical protein